MGRVCRAGTVEIGADRPLALIAGPCLLESLDLGLTVGRVLAQATQAVGLGFIFKASFDKANRTSMASPRGPGLERGLEQLAHVRRVLGVPVTTDIHEPWQAGPVAEVVDMLQIPAFLCRQTDLLVAAARAAGARGRAVNVKKGQFLSPHDMAHVVRKLVQAGCDNILLTERGTFFGYGRLVNDFIGLGDLLELDVSGTAQAPGRNDAHGACGSGSGNGRGATEQRAAVPAPPVCFDCTHSTQQPGTGEQTGGRPERAPLLARAAVAAGVHALFLECHPDPARAHSDAATMLPLAQVPPLLRQVAALRRALESGRT